MENNNKMQEIVMKIANLEIALKEKENFFNQLNREFKHTTQLNKALTQQIEQLNKETITEKKITKPSLDNFNFKYCVRALPDETVYSQIGEEIEEFHKWVISEAKQLKPMREKLINQLRDIVTHLYPEFDVII